MSFPLGVTRRNDPVKAYVTIIEGCNEFCSFCVVPYTRGHERMRPKQDILAEVREAAATGRREVQLLGQIVNHYDAPDDPGCDFTGLLEAIHEVPGIERIRFASPHPRHVSPRFLEAMARLPKICRHLHLPVQSGSTRVLAAMRRRYTRESYLDLVGSIRAAMPDVAPFDRYDRRVPWRDATATSRRRCRSREEARYHSMFSFKYSPRPNTLAEQRLADDVSEDEKTRRIVALQALQREIQTALNEALVGRTVEVLVDAREPAARDGAVGAHEPERRGERPRDRRAWSAPSRPGPRRAGGAAQRVGSAGGGAEARRQRSPGDTRCRLRCRSRG